MSVALVLQTLLGFSATGLFSALGTLLTDLNPNGPSAAAASANLVRYALAATFLAVLEDMMDHMGVGWCFTFSGLLSGLCGPLLVLEMQKGRVWRKHRQRGDRSDEEPVLHKVDRWGRLGEVPHAKDACRSLLWRIRGTARIGRLGWEGAATGGL